jgi:hypothetical protein
VPVLGHLDSGADYDRCKLLFAFHIDSGEIDGVDVSGLCAAIVGDTPQLMTDGNWKVGLVLDAAANDEQAEKLGAVFSGQLGGPPSALGPMLGELLGVERASSTGARTASSTASRSATRWTCGLRTSSRWASTRGNRRR